MNIKEAKQEIINTVRAYLKKDETGLYEIPVEKQRPILLIGPPGVGKTAVMEQVAGECGINLISYTITHHTRQSAIGLPYIAKHTYGGTEYSITEYTMSEIIASVYEQIERSGIREGILFLDEINCVSETLAPTMLQFLQYKTFGTHALPEGFIVVTAGNPPQYNKSVRDFDIVTLDRVKRIDVSDDFPVWKEYAYKAGVHGSILAYLEIKKENFYSIHTEVENRYFVTARGWEDLSRILYVYEELEIPVDENLVGQYLQDRGIARDFTTYYELYNKYRNVYRVPDILEGRSGEDAAGLRNAPFDEKLSLIGLLIDSLNGEYRSYAGEQAVQRELFGILKTVRKEMENGRQAAETLREQSERLEKSLQKKTGAGLLNKEEEKLQRRVLSRLEQLEKELILHNQAETSDFSGIRIRFAAAEEARKEKIRQTGEHTTNAFSFMAETFGEGQEMVIFLSELAAGYYSLKFVKECGNDAYFKYNRLLLLRDQRQELQQEIMQFI